MSAKSKAIITDQYCDDIRITHAIVYPECFEPFGVKNDTDKVRLHFGLKGNYSFSHKQINRTFHLVGGHHNLMYSKGFEISIQPHSVEIETFGIQFPKLQFIQFTQHANEELKRFSENVLTGQAVILSEQWGSLNGRIEHIINEINHNGYNDGLNRIFLLSKSLELLVLTADSYASAKNKNEIFIRTKSDKEKINAVRDLINDQLLLLPDLSGIAKATGLNEYKLKRGFKEGFQYDRL